MDVIFENFTKGKYLLFANVYISDCIYLIPFTSNIFSGWWHFDSLLNLLFLDLYIALVSLKKIIWNVIYLISFLLSSIYPRRFGSCLKWSKVNSRDFNCQYFYSDFCWCYYNVFFLLLLKFIIEECRKYEESVEKGFLITVSVN